jgi:hypothetical protein
MSLTEGRRLDTRLNSSPEGYNSPAGSNSLKGSITGPRILTCLKKVLKFRISPLTASTL